MRIKMALPILICLCWSPSLWSASYGEPITKSDILKFFEEIIEIDIPKLKPVWESGRILYTEFEDPSYFLGTFPVVKTIFYRKKSEKYRLEINKILYKYPPPAEALKAILVHEAKHILDYHNANTGRFLKILSYYTKEKWRSNYERHTDLFTLEKGYAKGLTAYRKWIYERLSKEGLKKKKCYYFTPKEISHWEMTGENSMNSYFDNYCSNLKEVKEQTQAEINNNKRRKLNRN